MAPLEPGWARGILMSAVLCGGGLWTGACSSAPRGEVIDLGAERFEATAVSPNEKEAHNDAYAAAIDFCAGRGKWIEVVEERSRYRGMDREARAGLAVAGALFGSMVGGYRGSAASGRVRGTTAKDEDYRYIVRFACTDRQPRPTPKESFFDSF